MMIKGHDPAVNWKIEIKFDLDEIIGTNG